VRQAEAPPTRRQLRNSRLTSSGSALVATSKSLGSDAQQQVAHAAADQETLVPASLQPVEHAQGVRRDVPPGNRVFVARDDARRAANGLGEAGQDSKLGFSGRFLLWA
jgi:hypothetical protein